MTKDEEIQTLDNIIEALPIDTYLRDVLTYIRPQFALQIRSDIVMRCNLQEAHYELKKVVQSTAAFRDDLKVIKAAIEKERAQLSELGYAKLRIEEQLREIRRNLDHVKL